MRLIRQQEIQFKSKSGYSFIEMHRIMKSDIKIEIYYRHYLTVVMQTFLSEHLYIFKVNDLGNLFSQQLQLYKTLAENKSLPGL